MIQDYFYDSRLWIQDSRLFPIFNMMYLAIGDILNIESIILNHKNSLLSFFDKFQHRDSVLACDSIKINL